MIDLHLHTTCSDGEYSPEDLVDMAATAGIKIMSITDHDTVMAYNGDIVNYALGKGIKLIPGIEFSTVDEDTDEKIHVLGYNLDIQNERLTEVCSIISDARREMVLKTTDKLNDVGIVLRAQKLLDTGSVITKTQIAGDVIDNPVNQSILIEKYDKLPLQNVFIEDYLTKNSPAHIQSDRNLGTKSAIAIIKQAGGKAICAHPSFNVMRGSMSASDMKRLILVNEFDGVEAINIQYDKRNGDQRFDMVEEFIEFANSNNLIISGGSDFHSDIDPKLGNFSHLGMTNEKHKVSLVHINNLLGKTIPVSH